MFEKQQIEAYQSITAPPELKSRISRSIEERSPENRKKKFLQPNVGFLAVAACLAVMFFSTSIWQDLGTMVSVNGQEVTGQAIELAATSGYGVAMASRARSVEPQLQIPLDLEVKKEAMISVSQGTLQTAAETASELELTESGQVYWCLTPDTNNPAVCIITTGSKEYTYVVELDEETNEFIMKQEK